MSNTERRIRKSFHWKDLLQYFFQGLIIIAPLGITLYVVISLFNAVDSFLPNIIHYLFPRLIEPLRIPGLGFLVVILIVLLVGKLSSSFFMSRIIELVETI